MEGAFKAPYFQYLLLPPPPPTPGWPLEVMVLGYRAGNFGVSGIQGSVLHLPSLSQPPASFQSRQPGPQAPSWAQQLCPPFFHFPRHSIYTFNFNHV